MVEWQHSGLHTYSENFHIIHSISRNGCIRPGGFVELKKLLDMAKRLTQASQHRALYLER